MNDRRLFVHGPCCQRYVFFHELEYFFEVCYGKKRTETDSYADTETSWQLASKKAKRYSDVGASGDPEVADAGAKKSMGEYCALAEQARNFTES